MSIAFVKTGWSDYYSGGPVLGNFKHIKNSGEGHECFNFMRAPDGLFYGYIPPIGQTQTVPKPEEKEDWDIIFVAKRPNEDGLVPVGWYRNAVFHSDYFARPEYNSDEPFETDVDGNKFCYCISADKGFLIPPSLRDVSFKGTHFGSTPIAYVSGDEPWRKELYNLANELFDRDYSDDEFAGVNPSGGFADPQHRKRVENAAIEMAIQHLKKLNYTVFDKQKDNCGYDLLAVHNQNGDEIHVEVKGTSNQVPRFFMSRNEHLYMQNSKWRLLIVSDALGSGNLAMMTKKQVIAKFRFQTLSYEATLK